MDNILSKKNSINPIYILETDTAIELKDMEENARMKVEKEKVQSDSDGEDVETRQQPSSVMKCKGVLTVAEWVLQ